MRFVICGLKITVLMVFLCVGSFGQSCEPGYKCPPVKEIQKSLTTFGLKEIKRLDRALKAAPSRAALYFRRGDLYRQIFLFFGPTMNYEGVVYETETDKKALRDLDRAISLSPHRNYFSTRAYLYEHIWDRQLEESRLRERLLGGERISWPEIEALLFKNEAIDGAERDYREASKHSKTQYDRTAYLDWHVKRLYHKVLYFTELEPAANPVFSKMLVENKKQAVVLDYWDKYIKFCLSRREAKTDFKIGEEEIDDLYRRKRYVARRIENGR